MQPHFVGESVQQKHRLSPGCVDLVPLHRDTGESAQAEVVDGTKLAAVPGKRRETSRILSQHARLIVCVKDLKVNNDLGT